MANEKTENTTQEGVAASGEKTTRSESPETPRPRRRRSNRSGRKPGQAERTRQAGQTEQAESAERTGEPQAAASQTETMQQPSAPAGREAEKAPVPTVKEPRPAARAAGKQEKNARSTKRTAGTKRTPLPPLDRSFHPLERAERPAKKTAGRPEKNDTASKQKHSPKSANRAIRWMPADYLLQLSVVVIGVMITFIGSGLVSRWQKAREVRTVMQLVYEELRADRESLVFISKALRYDRQGMLQLAEHDMDYRRVPVDTLAKYQYILGQVREFVPRTDALEVLRSSGTIASVQDKTLLLDILECYSWMSHLSSGVVDGYNVMKQNALNHLFTAGYQITPELEPLEWWRIQMNDPMCSAFFGSMSNYFDSSIYDGTLVERVDHVMKALNAKYSFE